MYVDPILELRCAYVNMVNALTNVMVLKITQYLTPYVGKKIAVGGTPSRNLAKGLPEIENKATTDSRGIVFVPHYFVGNLHVDVRFRVEYPSMFTTDRYYSGTNTYLYYHIEDIAEKKEWAKTRTRIKMGHIVNNMLTFLEKPTLLKDDYSVTMLVDLWRRQDEISRQKDGIIKEVQALPEELKTYPWHIRNQK